jgi:tetratricopeptide (TPR) repeat protein
MRLGLVLLLATTTSIAGASPAQELNAARDAFGKHDYGAAYPVLNALVHPTVRLARPDDLVEAYAMLGSCLVELGRPDDAVTEFVQLLQLQPERQLTSGFYSDPEIKVFDDTKAKILAENKAIEDAKKLADLAAAVEKLKSSQNFIEVHPYSRNFVPFGAGQFQNHTPIRGILFASTEAVTLATSVGTWYYLVNRFGFNAKLDRATDTATFHTVQRLEQLEIGTGVAFLALYAGGIIDSLLHYQPRQRLEFDESLLTPAQRQILKDAQPKKSPNTSSIHLTPILGDNAVGIGIGWEN